MNPSHLNDKGNVSLDFQPFQTSAAKNYMGGGIFVTKNTTVHLGLYFGSKKTGKISIVFEDLSRYISIFLGKSYSMHLKLWENPYNPRFHSAACFNQLFV